VFKLCPTFANPSSFCCLQTIEKPRFPCSINLQILFSGSNPLRSTLLILQGFQPFKVPKIPKRERKWEHIRFRPLSSAPGSLRRSGSVSAFRLLRFRCSLDGVHFRHGLSVRKMPRLQVRPRGFVLGISSGRKPSDSTGGTFTRAPSGFPRRTPAIRSWKADGMTGRYEMTGFANEIAHEMLHPAGEAGSTRAPACGLRRPRRRQASPAMERCFRMCSPPWIDAVFRRGRRKMHARARALPPSRRIRCRTHARINYGFQDQERRMRFTSASSHATAVSNPGRSWR